MPVGSNPCRTYKLCCSCHASISRKAGYTRARKRRHRPGRIYLPLDELQRFGVTEDDILHGRYGDGFSQLMEFQYQRARRYYMEAAALLPAVDRKNMIASEMMAQIYREILEKLHHTGYRVFDRREKLSKLRKGIILGGYLLRGFIGAV